MKRSWKTALVTMAIVLFTAIIVAIYFSGSPSGEFEWVDLDPTNPVQVDSLTGNLILEGGIQFSGPRTLAKWSDDDLEALKEELDYVKTELSRFIGGRLSVNPYWKEIEALTLWRLSILEEMKLVYPRFWEK